jgi:hypothetical protein
MEPSEVWRAVEAGESVASALGLHVDDAVVVHNSDRIAVRLTPCGVLARVGPPAHEAGFRFEVEVARRLGKTDSPIGELDPRVEPRVYMRDGFPVSLWTYYEPLGTSSDIEPADYGHALIRFHAGIRQIDLVAPHFTDRVADAQRAVGDREHTPDLLDADRDILATTLGRLSAAVRRCSCREQLLHGEPHPGNLLMTRKGLLFIDLGTCVRGPVEFDIAHGLLPSEDGRVLAVDAVLDHYPGANPELIEQCRILIWAMITTYRWTYWDQLPNRDYWAIEGLNQLREALDRYERQDQLE